MERERASRRGNGRQGEGEGVKERERGGFKERERASRRGRGHQGEGEGVKVRERASKRGRGGQLGSLNLFLPFPFSFSRSLPSLNLPPTSKMKCYYYSILYYIKINYTSY